MSLVLEKAALLVAGQVAFLAIIRNICGQCPARVSGSLADLRERQLRWVIAAYVEYFNESWPHPGINQHVPCGPPTWTESTSSKIIAFLVLDGLHHEYRRAA